MGGDDAIVIFEINRSGVFERGTQHIQIEIYRYFNTLVGLKPLEFESTNGLSRHRVRLTTQGQTLERYPNLSGLGVTLG